MDFVLHHSADRNSGPACDDFRHRFQVYAGMQQPVPSLRALQFRGDTGESFTQPLGVLRIRNLLQSLPLFQDERHKPAFFFPSAFKRCQFQIRSF
jgi:hypothetical protein